ncbi:MAG: IS3 family transposase, partial [Eubacteriales bacterium]
QNQAWSIDITYIKMDKSHQYLTAIVDWHSRYIVGWNLSETLDTSSVMQAVKEAVETHGKPEILNSDQGCQFTSNEYKNMLKDLEITQSMDGKARWADNIMIERWFRSLKVENIYTNEYLTPRSLRQGISAYIEQYNTVRPHEALGYKTPARVFFDEAEGLETAC